MDLVLTDEAFEAEVEAVLALFSDEHRGTERGRAEARLMVAAREVEVARELQWAGAISVDALAAVRNRFRSESARHPGLARAIESRIDGRVRQGTVEGEFFRRLREAVRLARSERTPLRAAPEWVPDPVTAPGTAAWRMGFC